MSTDAIQQIKASYAQVFASPRQLAARFYEELFSAAPKLRPLFPGDLGSLQGHFEAAIGLVVRNLEDMAALRESLRDLGAQHVHWGARPEDYLVAREALVAAIRSRAASTWDAALERHWRGAITAIIVPMLQGAAVDASVWAERLAEDSTLTD
jgi:hemoglobin-like flavoprotein